MRATMLGFISAVKQVDQLGFIRAQYTSCCLQGQGFNTMDKYGVSDSLVSSRD